MQDATEKGGEAKLGKAILDLADYAKAVQAAESKELPLGRKGVMLAVSFLDLLPENRPLVAFFSVFPALPYPLIGPVCDPFWPARNCPSESDCFSL